MLSERPFSSSLLLPGKPFFSAAAAAAAGGRPPPSFLPLRASSPPSPTLYDLLHLPPHVGPSDIKHAYRQLARKYHPDACPPDQSEESTRRFIEIQEAYETLSDPRRRAIYDQAIAMGVGSAAPGRMPWNMTDKAILERLPVLGFVRILCFGNGVYDPENLTPFAVGFAGYPTFGLEVSVGESAFWT